jgi:hypothetical protein
MNFGQKMKIHFCEPLYLQDSYAETIVGMSYPWDFVFWVSGNRKSIVYNRECAYIKASTKNMCSSISDFYTFLHSFVEVRGVMIRKWLFKKRIHFRSHK